VNRGRVLSNQNSTVKLESEEVLKLLREIEGRSAMTQRELSSRLGISLGKINFLLKALIDRGLVKMSNFKNSRNKAAYIYLLTPRGIEEKARITYHFLIQKTKEYETLEKEIEQLKLEVTAIDISMEEQS